MKLTVHQIQELNKHIDTGDINVKKHPTDDLFIYNYSAQCQYSSNWTEMTKMCRGLILDSEYNIVAKPFSKFFNHEELLANPPEDADAERPFRVYPKFDGSLGIAYVDSKGDVCIATRGSFIGKQAQWATEHIQKNTQLCDIIRRYHETETFLFEIIYPENRIVVDYGDMEGLVLISVNSNHTDGCLLETWKLIFQSQYSDVKIPTANLLDEGHGNLYHGDFRKLKEHDENNAEGYVILFYVKGSFQRIKIKFENYIRKHKIYSGITPKNLWEMLKNRDDVHTLVQSLPDELFGWVDDLIDQMRGDYVNHYTQIYYLYDQNKNSFEDRKSFAEWAKEQTPYTSYLFMVLDGKDIQDKVWDLVHPGKEIGYD